MACFVHATMCLRRHYVVTLDTVGISGVCPLACLVLVSERYARPTRPPQYLCRQIILPAWATSEKTNVTISAIIAVGNAIAAATKRRCSRANSTPKGSSA